MKKPFYKKWWFLLLIAIFVIGAIASPFVEKEEKSSDTTAEEKADRQREKEREKELKKEEKEKEKEELRLEQEKKEIEKEKLAIQKEREKELKKEEKEKEKIARDEEKRKEKEEKEKEKAAARAEKENKEKEDAAKEKETPLPEHSISDAVESIVKEDLGGVSIAKLMVNEDMGKEDGTYIVLPHLSWADKNNPKRTRQMLESYSDHLAAKLSDDPYVGEITVFWEVPHHMEGENIVKFSYSRNDKGMAKSGVWYAPILRP